MSLKLFVLSCLFASSLAWLAPERCSQEPSQRTRRSETTTNAIVVANIEKIANQQHAQVITTYEGYEFVSVPSQIAAHETFPQDFPDAIKVSAPYNCTFHTYEPHLVVGTGCDPGVTCKISQSVATVDTYTAAEGYSWGVKVSVKFNLFNKVFEVGGEANTGGTYSCTYTKGRTTTTLVECTDSTGEGSTLGLYSVQTDMMCDFGTVIYNTEERGEDPNWYFVVDEKFDYFTRSEVQEIKDCVGVRLTNRVLPYLLDTDKISDTLLAKLMRKATLYNPFTDLISVDDDNIVTVIYYKIDESTRKYEVKRLIPFTNKHGDAIQQFRCSRK